MCPIKLNTIDFVLTFHVLKNRSHVEHRPDSLQGTDYIATNISGFLGQTLKI